MCYVYRVSSSCKVEQMEAELLQQLSALRAEIEEKELHQKKQTSRCYKCGGLTDEDHFMSCVISNL